MKHISFFSSGSDARREKGVSNQRAAHLREIGSLNLDRVMRTQATDACAPPLST